ncbi:GNAT family N-acetyltransferase [Acidimangrovimonas pyrenivorans]|uniref:GNAT family N-acetyltransferase n=1 Tax=Acidimangrovimonas pyrenivorans TaxID=2030798 RepID=A0ABV7AN34_9RHOB
MPEPFETLPADALSPDLVARWHALQAQSPALANPFFSPGFTQAVGRHRPDLRVAVLRDGNTVTGLFPFHRKPGGCGAPVGGQISDYQGVIAAPDSLPDAGDLLVAAGLGAYDFNHALAEQAPFAAGAFWHSASPRADLSDGIEAWRGEVRARSSALKTLERKRRKLTRELGELRFLAHDPSAAAWQSFLDWKARSLGKQGVRGFLAEPWLAGLIDDLRATQEPEFGGYLSTLYAGDRLVAVHFGLRSARVWHWWFPTYDEELGSYSPGLILMLLCIEEAAATGMIELDFGRGTQRYKREFSNRSRPLCEGSLERWTRPCGTLRGLRKFGQGAANRLLPRKGADFTRRAGTKLLRAGLI